MPIDAGGLFTEAGGMGKRPLLEEAELKALLAENGFDVSKTHLLDSGSGVPDVWMVPCRDENNWFVDWELAKSLVSLTGRWPVICQAGDIRFEFGNSSAADFIARADEVDLWGELPSLDGTYARTGMEDRFDRVIGRAPLRADDKEAHKAWARETLGAEATELEIQRWLVHRGAECIPPEEGVADQWEHLELYGLIGPQDHSNDPDIWLAFIPSDDQAEGLAYVASFSPIRPDLRVALAREWNKKFGVEYVGAVTLYDLFIVETPPTDPDDIWDVARSAFALWPDIDMGFKADGHPYTLAKKLKHVWRWAFSIYP